MKTIVALAIAVVVLFVIYNAGAYTVDETQARKSAQELMGEGDAQALEIYANAYNRDVSFYRFWRTLESYKATLKEGDTVVLSTDSEYLRFLERLSEKK